MSGTGKKVVDVAFKAGKTIDWEGMAKLIVSDQARKEFATLRRAFDEVNTSLTTKFSQEPEPIDWEYYRKGIGSRLVDMYKEAYEMSSGRICPCLALHLTGIQNHIFAEVKLRSRIWIPLMFGVEVPKYVDTVTPEYKPKFDALSIEDLSTLYFHFSVFTIYQLVELKEAEATSLKESERLEKEIVEVQELKQKISTMTADEYFEKHPEVKKKFDDEIRNDYWGY
ncbi:hypothetical protein TEA_019315 [Camellia sinensis var. sinensis]|uniref:Uncharacterized protein n=1 Tax=Camellia sinensis var. sinensis TaxID=542762 RepID=A0A4S4ER01_CAMSN|nr:hypothetical protein TEA_019315 [Camellia sinensis var. sinensis]